MIIDEAAKQRAWQIWDAGQSESQYFKMVEEMNALEDRYEHVLEKLPEAQGRVIRDFVLQRDAMNWRMLEIACALMRFPKCEDE